jgi:hypothetical protein
MVLGGDAILQQIGVVGVLERCSVAVYVLAFDGWVRPGGICAEPIAEPGGG